jgi:hypothetical protein
METLGICRVAADSDRADVETAGGVVVVRFRLLERRGGVVTVSLSPFDQSQVGRLMDHLLTQTGAAVVQGHALSTAPPLIPRSAGLIEPGVVGGGRALLRTQLGRTGPCGRGHSWRAHYC